MYSLTYRTRVAPLLWTPEWGEGVACVIMMSSRFMKASEGIHKHQ